MDDMDITGSIVNHRYKIQKKLGHGTTSDVYAAWDTNNGNNPCAIKILKKEFISPLFENIIRLKNEALIISRFTHPAIVKIYEIGESVFGHYIAMEYIEGTSLSEMISPREGTAVLPSPECSLEILSQLAAALEHVHGAGIIHRDLKPGNVLLRGTGQSLPINEYAINVAIIDFGLAKIKDYSRFESLIENEIPVKDQKIVGTFGYMAPEILTGSKNGVDERSDLYSLGVLMYELLTGKPPFIADTIHSMINLHLSKEPTSPSIINPEIPPVVSSIVLKLLEKEPARRYQSAAGLLSDLVRHKTGKNEYFIPGRDDRIGKLSYKTILIGRDTELGKLKALAAALKDGIGNLCLINGEPGIGKTKLSEELRSYAYSIETLFIQGNCFSGKSKTPYLPLSLALDAYILKYRNYSIERKERAAKRIRQALGDLGEIIVKINPAMKEILGDCPPLPGLDPEKENRRFLSAVSSFFCQLSKIEHGMILLFEDLHWGDDGSLAIMLEIARDIACFPLLMICTYRDDEIAPGHGIMKIIRASVEQKLPLHRIGLIRFDPEYMKRFTMELLNKNNADDSVREVSDFIQIRSKGNPLFAVHILKQLIDEQALSYGGKNQLVLDRAIMTKVEIPTTIAAMLLKRVSLLDNEEINMLAYAAVIGRKFPLSLFLKLSLQMREQFMNGTEQSFNENCIGIIDQAIELHLLEEDAYDRGKILFAHDMIHEALYNQLDHELKKNLHAKTMALFERLHEESGNDLEHSPYLFDLAHHASRSENRVKTIEYSLPAGIKAREQHAHNDALKYFTEALSIIETTGEQSEVLVVVKRNIADLYRAMGRYDEAIALFRDLLAAETRDIERGRIYRDLMQAFFSKGDFLDCEQYGRSGLQLLGENLPNDKFGIIASMTRELLTHFLHTLFPKKNTGKKLIQYHDRYALIVGFYYTLNWLYVISDNLKFVRSVLRMLNISERAIGRSKELAMSLSMYAVLEMAIRHFDRSIRHHQQVLVLRRELNDEWGTAQSYQLMGYCYYFKCENDQAQEYFKRSIDLFTRMGDTKELVMSLIGKILSHSKTSDIGNAIKTIDQCHAIASRSNDNYGMVVALFYRGQLYCETGDFENGRDYLLKTIDMTSQYKFWNVCIGAYIQLGKKYLEQGDHCNALEYIGHAADIERREKILKDSSVALYHIYAEALILEYETDRDINQTEKKLRLKKIQAACQTAVAKTNGFPNHFGETLRVMAKYHAMVGNRAKAENFFMKSITFFNKFPILVKRAYAKTLYDFGIFLGNGGNSRLSQQRLEEAYRIFNEISDLAYSKKIKNYLQINEHTDHEQQSIIALYYKVKENKKFSSLIELITTMSSDLNPLRILADGLSLAIEMTGASRGLILLKNKTGDLETATTLDINNPDNRSYSLSVVKQVMENGSPLLITDAEAESELSQMDSVAFGNLRSILCYPIRYRKEIIGVCYLDNPLSGGIFTQEEIKILDILIAQISVAVGDVAFPREENKPVIQPSESFCKQYGITKRELEIIALKLKGLTNEAIGQNLKISTRTVDNHMYSINMKTNTNRIIELLELIKKTDQ